MQRSGKIAFAASRLVSAVLTSAAVLCLGYGLFVIFTVIMFPSVMDTNSHSAAAVLHSMSIGCFYLSRMAGACIYHLRFQQKQIYDDLHTVYVLLFLQHSYKQTFKRVFRQCRKDRQLIFIQRDIPSHRKRHDCVCDLSRSRIDDTCGDNWRQLLAKEV